MLKKKKVGYQWDHMVFDAYLTLFLLFWGCNVGYDYNQPVAFSPFLFNYRMLKLNFRSKYISE